MKGERGKDMKLIQETSIPSRCPELEQKKKCSREKRLVGGEKYINGDFSPYRNEKRTKKKRKSCGGGFCWGKK